MTSAPDPATVAAFRGPLLDWFVRNRRDFPWRKRRTPYRVWVAELMLQQTRADQALPYYRRFMRQFPSLKALAEAPLDKVLKAWEGLGYYTRARHLHRTAIHILRERNGRFPRTCRELLELPGVGPYTAAAIASLAFGEDVAVVDGNVVRVLSRVQAWSGDPSTSGARRQFQAWSDALLPPGRAGLFNEAVMELGATLCAPKKPRCPDCPLRAICRAQASGRPETWPAKKTRKPPPLKVVGAAVVEDGRGRVLIARRKADAMLGGLWEFPGGTLEPGETIPECIARELKEELDITISVGPPLARVRHAYSHFTIDLHAHRARILSGRPKAIGCDDWKWVRPDEMAAHPFSRADLKIIEALADSDRGKSSHS